MTRRDASDTREARRTSSVPTHGGARSSRPAALDKSVDKGMEDEVNGALGGLLGLLEVLSIDVEEPLSPRQQGFVAAALSHGDSVRQRVEALLVLLTDESDPRFLCRPYTLRRLVDHAVRAAGWSARERQVTLQLPEPGPWETHLVSIDAPRVDRALRHMTDALVGALSPHGTVALTIELGAEQVWLTLSGVAPEEPPTLRVPAVVSKAWHHLLQLSGGRLKAEPEALRFTLELPTADAEEAQA